MDKETILARLKELKPQYEKEGFIIKGIFGSYARDEADESSDIDIAIELERGYIDDNDVWLYFKTLDAIKRDIWATLGRKSDIFDLNSNSQIVENIKKELVYV